MSFLSSFRSAASTSRIHRNKALDFPRTRMSIIEEDHIHTPSVSHHPALSQLYLESLPHRNSEAPPPPYNFSKTKFDVETRKPVERNVFSTPGTWRRILVLCVTILCLGGLVLGLGFGLTHKGKHTVVNNHPPDSSAPAVPISPSNSSFPAGNWTLNTVLTTADTSCTSSQATWRCFPYTTFSSSGSSAAATFIWTIRANSLGNNTITASPNAFAPSFASIPLTLVDSGLPNERYIFSFNTTKAVVPSEPLDASNTAATCFYNSTTFEAALYTRMDKTYPSSVNNTTSDSQDWPYAVEISEIAPGGEDVPNCFNTQGNAVGSFVAQDTSQDCSCIYTNFGPNLS